MSSREHIISIFLHPLHKGTTQEDLKYLQPIIEAVPRESEREPETWKQWWQVSGESVIPQLKSTMIKNRNIGQSWEFTEEQIIKLQKYYQGNMLIARCLNSISISIDASVRKQIEEMLLLPIAEIEKLKVQAIE